MSAQHLTDEEYKSQVAAVWRVTIILSIVTVVEVIIALLAFYHIIPIGRAMVNVLFVLLSVAKAGYIIGEFMHLKYEKRALMLSLGFPLVFLIWGIIALLYEGHVLHNVLYMIQ